MAKLTLIAPSYSCSVEEMKVIRENIGKIGFFEIEDFTTENILFDKWAGSFEERLNNFYKAWNSNSKAIMCCKGGSGASHFMPLIKKRNLKKKKLLVGYSDITILLNFISANLGILTIHGPNLSKKMDEKTLFALKNALEMRNYGLKFTKNQCYNVSDLVLKGKTIGGNLGRFVETLIYTNLDFKGKIVFLEETLFTEHKIFNLLTSLKHYPSFKPKAIVFGNLGVKDKKLMKEMILSLFPNIPLIFDMKFGHTIPNLSIPIGVDCNVDFEKEKLHFIFSKKNRKYSVNF